MLFLPFLPLLDTCAIRLPRNSTALSPHPLSFYPDVTRPADHNLFMDICNQSHTHTHTDGIPRPLTTSTSAPSLAPISQLRIKFVIDIPRHEDLAGTSVLLIPNNRSTALTTAGLNSARCCGDKTFLTKHGIISSSKSLRTSA